MKKQCSLGRAARWCATICILGCAGLLGCNKSQDTYMPDDFDDFESSTSDNAEEYDAWVQKFGEQLKNDGAAVAGQPGFVVGATGAAPSFNFAAATTGDAPATFNFGAAATTGDAPATFNFGAAATTGDAPATFNFGAAATTGDAPATFNFGAAATTGSAPVAFNFNPAPKKETPSSFNGGAAVATVDGADPLTQVLRKKAALKAAAVEAGKVADQATAKATQAAKALANANDALTKAKQTRDSNADAVETAKNAVAVAKDAETKASAAVEQATEEQKTAAATLQKAEATVNEANAALAKNVAEQTAAAEELKAYDAETAQVASKKEAASNALNAANDAVKLAQDDAAKSQDALKSTKTQVQASVDAAQSLKDAYQNATGKAAEAEKALQQAREALEALAEDAEESERSAAQDAVKAGEDALAAARDAATAAEKAFKDADQALAAARENERKVDELAAAASKVVDEKKTAANGAKDELAKIDAELTKRGKDRQAFATKVDATNVAAKNAAAAETAAKEAFANAQKTLDAANANLAKLQENAKTAVAQREASEGNLAKSQDALTQANADVKAAETTVATEAKKANQAQKEQKEAEAARDKAQKEADTYATKIADASPKNFFFAELATPYAAIAGEVVRVPSSENLEEALNSLVEALERDVDDLAMIPDFEDGVVAVQRDANALAVVALVVGASDADSPSKPFAASLINAARGLANAKSAADVKAGLANVKKARQTKSDKKVTWDSKVASLRPIMKSALPALSTDIKRLARNEKTFLRRENARKTINASTIMTACALGCRENVDETLAPDSEDLWREYCAKLADAALDYNEKATALATGAGSFDALKDAGKKLEETCSSTCHEKFGGRSAE